jgi:predicted TIM-barrel fold metal-dependent hydrolase
VIIDCHCHAGKGDGFSGPWDTSAPIEAHLQRARAAGIDKTVIFAAFTRDYRAANRAIAAMVKRRPRELLGFAFVHAARDRGRIRELLGEAFANGLVGIKVHRSDARITREICESAQESGAPILYDVLGEVETVELIAREYPKVPFIIPHLGSFADDWKVQRALLDPLQRCPNVFADTSGVRRFDVLHEAVSRCGAEKILFGSDGPWLHPAVELTKIRALQLSRDAEARVLGVNLLRLLRRFRSPGITADRQIALAAPCATATPDH